MYDQSTIDTLEFHRSMLIDDECMTGYLKAILASVKPEDVVLDIGCGTWVLTYFACVAGAVRVYAIEQGPVIELAKAISRHSGYHHRVTFIRD